MSRRSDLKCMSAICSKRQGILIGNEMRSEKIVMISPKLSFELLYVMFAEHYNLGTPRKRGALGGYHEVIAIHLCPCPRRYLHPSLCASFSLAYTSSILEFPSQGLMSSRGSLRTARRPTAASMSRPGPRGL